MSSFYFSIFIKSVFFVAIGLSQDAHSQEQIQTTQIAVASNFAKTIRTLVSDFKSINKYNHKQHKIKISIASSGKLYAQIKHGAPFDIFLSADQKFPRQLIDDNLAIRNSLKTYAIGRLVLWSSDSNSFPEEQFTNTNTDFATGTLSNPNLNKFALANSRLAPYGRAAEETLKSLKLLELTRSKWIKGENISQTFQYVYTGNVELGFVALSQILDKNGSINKGSGWLVPTHLYTSIKQDSVILKRGKKNTYTLVFYDYLTSDRARNIIQQAGYFAKK